MKANPWSVHKFGGSSLADASCYRNVLARLQEDGHETRKTVVVSSMAGVTDALYTLVSLAREQQDFHAQLVELANRQRDTARDLLSTEGYQGFEAQLTEDCIDISQVLRASWLLKGTSQAQEDWVVGYGEIWSARLMARFLTESNEPAQWLNARDILFVQHGETTTSVLWERSREALQQACDTHREGWLVLTGFIASLADGTPTTLKRDGSDLSASIIAALLEAQQLTIWTDVNGVFSADPRRVPEAEQLTILSWQEATELAYFGANILHPHAMAPAMRHHIPITIRNTFQPDNLGTSIQAADAQPRDNSPKTPVKGFSTIDGMALINIEGAGMMGVPGIAHRLFGALRELGISVVMISQASSEHSICFAVPAAQGEQTCEVVREAFYREFAQGRIQTVDLVSPCSILAAVGDDMVEVPGVAAQFFDALGKAGVNVRAIAQGSSERNISAVIDQQDSARALRAVHAGFYLSQQTLSVGLVGPGLIGKALLNQLRAQASLLREQFHIDLRLYAITNSRKMLLSEHNLLEHDNWEEAFANDSVPADLDAFAQHIKAEHLPHRAIIDCTASGLAAEWYPTWLAERIHILTPNKKAFSSAYNAYQTIRNTARQQRVHAFYEATVGAGLPVISTLRDLLQTGDEIIEIEGIFSGTLSYIFNTFSQDMPFSEVVKQAKEQGFTEPDPRDDLSGMDVARKLVILAREMGLTLEMDALSVHNLVPEPLRDLEDVGAFLDALQAHDEALSSQLAEAEAQGQVLRYVGSIRCTDGQPDVSVSLKSYPNTHAFARISGSDNIIAFRTRRYDKQALIIQGPGAGPDVTAGGVFADLLRLAAHLGAAS